MKNIIKGQVALLVSMLAAIAITLTACGGGSSSSAAGGSSVKTASVSGTVTNGGVSALNIRSGSDFVTALGNAIIPAAHAATEYLVEVNCDGGGNYSGNTVNGKFKIMVNVTDTENCNILVDGESAGIVAVTQGRETEVKIAVGVGAPLMVDSFDKGPENSTQVEIEIEDEQSSDDVASADDISSDDGVSDDGESDGASDAESADGNSDDDSSNSQSNV